MSYSNLGSAIDDDFEPNFFPGPLPEHDDDSVYNGPRSGHWSISSSIGSAIDDRCPTVWGHTYAGGNQGGGGARPIDGGLLKRLGKTTIEDKRKAEMATALAAHESEEIESAKSERRDRVKPEQSKGFYLPRLDVKKPPPAKAEPERERETSKKAREPTPAPSVASKESSFHALPARTQPTKTIRIKAKDGREAFVKLPQLPRVSAPPSRAPSVVAEEPPTKRNNEAKQQKKAEGTDDERKDQAKAAAKALMSGALPATKKKKKAQKQNEAKQKPPPPKPHVETAPPSDRNSAKDSAVGFGGMFEGTASEKPPSANSSKPITVKSLQDAVRNISENSKRSKTPSVAGFDEVGNGWTRVKEPSEQPFIEIGGGWTPAGSNRASQQAADPWTQPQSGSKRSSRHTPAASSGREHAFGGPSFGVEQTQRATSHHSSRRSVHGNNGTVFAGTGWITPHPLSAASTEVAARRPQSVINLHGREMSYEEWQAMKETQKEEVRSNRSMVSGRSGSQKGGSVISEGVLKVAASIAGSRKSAAGSQGMFGDIFGNDGT